ncbi:MAG: Xaa-Pro peptidase family protein, partial [Planctomycetota bacterium]|nr:Xaa-Pro peptidase family protein [Planctomycetota bacterium]
MDRKEFAARRDAFFDELSRARIGAAVLDRRADQYYYTGYTGSDAVAVFRVRDRKGWLVTDSRYAEEAAKSAPGLEVTLWKRSFSAFTGALLRKFRTKKTAYTPTGMTAAFFDEMRSAAPAAGEWVRAEEIISAQRSVKSGVEIAAMRAALACAEAAFLSSRRRWKAGMTEIDVKNDLEWEMRKRGAEDAAFKTIVAAGPNASLPHAHAGGRKIVPGRMLLIDFGARVNRYNSDLTRTLWAGSVPAAWKKRYEAVLAAQRAGIAAIKPGVPGVAAHQAAMAVFAGAG